MKVVVCTKCVPEGRARIDPVTKRLERDGAAEINTFDRYAIEEAVQIKERSEAEVVIISMGVESTTEALRDALALGADRAVLVSDPEAAGSDLLSTSRVLAKAIEREGADLVLFGQQASEGGGALLWSAVAELLRLPCISQTTRLELQEGSLRATRQSEVGDDVIESPLPAVVAVTDAINELRYTSLKGRIAAKKKPLDVLALSDLGLDVSQTGISGSGTDVRSIAEPPSRANVLKIEGDEGTAQVILDYLAERRLV